MFASVENDEVRNDLEAIDGAAMRLRRFVAGGAPDGRVEGERIEMSTLLVVDAVSRRSGRAAIGAIASDLHVAPTTATRFVDRAQRAGMVQRVPAESDRRQVDVVLTEAGSALDARALDYRVGRLAGMLVDWPRERIARFAADLEEFADLADAAPGEGAA